MARPLHLHPSTQAVRAHRVRRGGAWAVLLLAAVACAPLAQRWGSEVPAAPVPAGTAAQHGPAPGAPPVEVQRLDPAAAGTAPVGEPMGAAAPSRTAAAMPRTGRVAEATGPAETAARADEDERGGPDPDVVGIPALDGPLPQASDDAGEAGGDVGTGTARATPARAVPAAPSPRNTAETPRDGWPPSMWGALFAAGAGVLLIALWRRRRRSRAHPGAASPPIATTTSRPPPAAGPSFQPTDDDDVMQTAVQPEPTQRAPHAPDMSPPHAPLLVQTGPAVAADAAVLRLGHGGGSSELVAHWWLQDDELDYWHEWCTPVGVLMEMMPPALTAAVDAVDADAAGAAPAVAADPHAKAGAAEPQQHPVLAAAPPAMPQPQPAPLPQYATEALPIAQPQVEAEALPIAQPRVDAQPVPALQSRPEPQPRPVATPAAEPRAATALQQLEAACAASAGVLVLVDDPDLQLPRVEQTMDAPPAAQALVLLHDAVQVPGSMGMRSEQTEEDAWAHSEMLRVQVGHGARDGVKAAATRANAIIDARIYHAQGRGLDAWRSQRIRLKLAAATRETGVARLLALRALRADAPEQTPAAGPAVLKAWVDVLWYWSSLLRGDAAQPLFAETVSTCQALQQWPEQKDEAHCLLGHTFARRAATELGGVRVASLEQAQALHDALHARTGSARSALAVAQTALVRLQGGVAGDASELCAHALKHAFHAGSDPRTAARALHCRLQLQLAYESLPGVPAQGDVALGLVRSLATAPALPLPTVEHMVAVLLRHDDARAACALCEAVLRAGQDSPALRQAWDTASRRWGQTAQGADRAAWQTNTRQRHLLAR